MAEYNEHRRHQGRLRYGKTPEGRDSWNGVALAKEKILAA
jgi:hypothetical protein